MRWSAFVVGAALLVQFPGELIAKESEQTAEEAFDAQAAWDEYEAVIRGYYGYIERDDFDVKAQLERSRALAVKALNEAVVRRLLHQTSLTFSDPHLIVGPFEDSDYAIIMSAADLWAGFDDGIARIKDVRRSSPAFDAGLRSEDIIVSIDGVQANDAALLPFGPVLADPTDKQRDYGLTLAVNGKRSGERILEVRGADGTARTVTLASTREYARGLADRPLVDLAFVGEKGDIAVITPLNSLGNNASIQAFDEVMERTIDARAVILDMRETPSGGNTEVARSIIGHFVTETVPYQMHRVPSLEREFTVPRQFVEYVYPRNPGFTGPVVVLHGKWTGSMGEGIVIGMDAATDAITIGSDMGDLLGGLWNINLEKSGARLDLGVETLFHVNGTPREDFTADIEIVPASTSSDGGDPALASALKYLETLRGANQSR